MVKNSDLFYKGKKFISLVLSAGIFACFLFGCANSRQTPVSDTGFYFDTVITITIYDASKKDALEHCFKLAEKYEGYFDATDPNSDISKINANPFVPVAVHEETIELIRKGIAYGKISEGRFDITVGRLSGLWDFSDDIEIPADAAKAPSASEGHSSFTLPDQDEVKRLASGVDYTAVSIDEKNKTVTLASDSCAIDLGGIAKGYIADQMKAYLKNEGITSALINLGGNVLALGAKPDGKPFAIGIQKPFSPDGEPILKVSVTDSSVVTSGTYQRCATIDGRLYHHIIDTSTGYPYDNGLSSVTVLSSSSTDGDALSTSLFALGLKEGLARVNQMKDVSAIFITTDNEIYYSDGIDEEICTKL